MKTLKFLLFVTQFILLGLVAAGAYLLLQADFNPDRISALYRGAASRLKPRLNANLSKVPIPMQMRSKFPHPR